MAYEKKDMTGALFANDKGGNEKRPDRTGYVIFQGVEYRLSGWIKEGRSGPFLSLAISELGGAAKPPSKRQDSEATSNRVTARNDMDDEIPF